MSLSSFLREYDSEIVTEWEAFAGTLRPASRMTRLQLTNHIREILVFLADDIEQRQSAEQQFDKSQGKRDSNSVTGNSPAQVHATLRHQDGYDIVEMVSEYRALRASVTRLWLGREPHPSAQDVLDLGRFHEAIDQALAESVARFTQDVDAKKDVILGVLGHDIRSPVGAILMAASLMPRVGQLNERQHHLVEQIEHSADRIHNIVADLLDMAKAKAGGVLPLKKAATSISSICERIVEEMRTQHPDREIRLHAEPGVEGNWDPIRLGQVVSNLLSNAIQYGDAEKPLDVALQDSADVTILSVTNHGQPIPLTQLETIFNSFTRGDDALQTGTSAPNLGLGLFICKEIVTAHGGTIDVKSSAETGTTFTVCLPKCVSTGEKRTAGHVPDLLL